MSDVLQLNLFNKSRISDELLNCSCFVEALHLIEKTIGNPHLSVKFSQTCIARLRNEQLYDLGKSRRHIPAIYSHLVLVIQNINITVEFFRDRWSCFTLGDRKQRSFDKIIFDRAMISGASRSGEDTSREDTRARLIFFLYAKLLHELAHASMAELGRKLPSGDFDDRFSSPATHAMTGEAGNSIERHFFGSVVDAHGRYTDTVKSMYSIEHVILREKQSKSKLTDAYLRQFIRINFATIESIPQAQTEELRLTFRSPRRKRSLAASPTDQSQ